MTQQIDALYRNFVARLCTYHFTILIQFDDQQNYADKNADICAQRQPRRLSEKSISGPVSTTTCLIEVRTIDDQRFPSSDEPGLVTGTS
jgi:hypothetical protein